MDHAQELDIRPTVNHNANKAALDALHDPAPPSPNSNLSSPGTTVLGLPSVSPEPGQVHSYAAGTQQVKARAAADNAGQQAAAQASTLSADGVADGGSDSVYGSYGPGLGFLQPLAPPGASEGAEAVQEYEQYTKRWKACTTLAQRWDRLEAKGRLATIRAEWEDLSLDIALQERCWHTPQAAAARAAAAAARAAEGMELNKRAPRGSRRRPELDADVCLSPTGEGRNVRCRNAPKMFQDFQVDLPHNKKLSSSEPDSATEATPPASPGHVAQAAAAAASDEETEGAVARRAPGRQHQQGHPHAQGNKKHQHQQAHTQAQGWVQENHARGPAAAAASGTAGAQGLAAVTAVRHQPVPMPMPAQRHVGAAAAAAAALAGPPGAEAAVADAMALLRMLRAVGLDGQQLQEALQLMHQLSAAFGDSRPDVFQEFQRQCVHFARDPATFIGYMRAVVHTLASAQQQPEQQQQEQELQHRYLQQQLQQHQLEQQMQHKRARQQ